MIAEPSAGSTVVGSSSRCPVTVSFEMCTSTSPTTSVPVTRSPGRRPSSTPAAALNGIVMPGMKPLMSWCLIVTSPLSGATA